MQISLGKQALKKVLNVDPQPQKQPQHQRLLSFVDSQVEPDFTNVLQGQSVGTVDQTPCFGYTKACVVLPTVVKDPEKVE